MLHSTPDDVPRLVIPDCPAALVIEKRSQAVVTLEKRHTTTHVNVSVVGTAPTANEMLSEPEKVLATTGRPRLG
jgi:hypothetical protein